MSIYHTKPVEVQAAQFLQHKRPWPEGVDMVYAHGIPEARLDGQSVRHGDWVIGLPGGRSLAMPADAFMRLFDLGVTPTEATDVEK